MAPAPAVHFFTSPVSSDHQDRLVVCQMLQDVITQVVADLIGVPLGPPEQVLHSVRGGFPGPLGDGVRQSCAAPGPAER